MSTDSRIRRLALTAAFLLGAVLSPLASAAETTAPTAAASNRVPADRATYFGNSNLQNIWKDLESRQVINQRIVEGGSYSVNVRIVKPTDAPLVHQTSFDVWVVTAGSATAITGGELLNPVQRANADDKEGSSIRGGTEQALKTGDILFIPPGVAHGFKDINGFHAFLMRFEAQGAAAKP